MKSKAPKIVLAFIAGTLFMWVAALVWLCDVDDARPPFECRVKESSTQVVLNCGQLESFRGVYWVRKIDFPGKEVNVRVYRGPAFLFPFVEKGLEENIKIDVATVDKISFGTRRDVVWTRRSDHSQ